MLSLPLKKIVAAQQGGGRGASLWGVDLSNKLRCNYQQGPGTNWSGWSGEWAGSSPRNISKLAGCKQNNGVVQLWALVGNELHTIYQNSPGGGWSNWT